MTLEEVTLLECAFLEFQAEMDVHFGAIERIRPKMHEAFERYLLAKEEYQRGTGEKYVSVEDR